MDDGIGIFDGIKVLEVAEWTFVPAAGAILAELGADVIKVERPVGGDQQRGTAVSGVTPSFHGTSIQMEVTNRGGKRSVGIDITSEGGRDLVYRLAAQADVFLTSLLPHTRERLGYGLEPVREANPDIVYAVGHGPGPRGPDADKGGYDMTAYWCRGGFAYAATDVDFPSPVKMRPAIGDKAGCMNLVAGVSAALFRRERTGKPSLVEVSLLGTAVWQLSSDLLYSKALGIENSRESRGRNCLSGYYETADGRWIALALLEPEKWWPRFAALAGIEDLLDDPRFDSYEAREKNYEECVGVIAECFRRYTLAEWRERFEDFGGPWAPLQSSLEVAEDPQVVANSYITDIVAKSGVTVPVAPAPIRFDDTLGRLDPCPEPGEHTEEVLLELGESWESIIEMKDAGFVQ